MSPARVSRAGLSLALALIAAALLLPSGALGATCTDTWTGPAEGEWQTGGNWSLGSPPIATDVACIGPGKTVLITGGINQTGVLQDEGTVSISGGSLELASGVEASSAVTLSLIGGTLVTVDALDISSSFTGGGFGTLKGVGSVVIQKGAKGTLVASSASSMTLEEGTLDNEGTLTLGEKSGLQASKKAQLVNSGTLIVNGDGSASNHGLIASAGEATLTNTGVVEKTEGAATRTPIQYVMDNEGEVSDTEGVLELSGGGTSGTFATGSWSTSGSGVGILFNTNGGTFSLGAVVPMKGAIEVLDGTVSAGKIEGGAASMTLSGAGLSGQGMLDVTGKAPSTLHDLTITDIENRGGGVLEGPGEVDITNTFTGGGFGTLKGTGSTVIEPGAKGSATTSSANSFTLEERTLKNEGTFTIGEKSGINASKGAQLINSGTLILNGDGNASNHGLIASPGAATLTNTGLLEKTEGSATTTPIQYLTANEGKILDTAGKLELTAGGASGEHATGSWSASGAETEIVFNTNGGTFALGATVPMSGAFEVVDGTVSAGKIEGASASVTINGAGLSGQGMLDVTGAEASTLQNLTITDIETRGGGVLEGPAEVDITNSFTGGGFGTLKGSGSTVIEPGAKGTTTASSADSFSLEERTLKNEGTFTVGLKSGVGGRNKAQLINTGTLILNGESESENHGLTASEKEAKLINLGTLKKTEGTGVTPIEFEFENLGSIVVETGAFKIFYPVAAPQETQWGSGNSSAPGQEHPSCGDPVNCASGNFYETQTDLAISGLGVGLNLARTYNSQAGAAGISGAFGTGWSSSFSDRLVVEKTTATLHQGNGSTVPFTEGKGEAFTGPAWTQDTLSGSASSGYSLVLANQVKYQFEGSTGRLQSVSDRNGNQTKLAYDKAGRLEAIADPAGRRITFAYNGEGLVESAKDPLGHTVKYTYEGGTLASVTLPGEAKARWQYHYDGSHQMTSMIDGKGGETVNEYNGAHEVSAQTDPAGRKLKFEYEPFQTKITNNGTGSVAEERFTSNGEPFSITRGFGTGSASTESFTYDTANDLLSETDGNGHTTTYTYENANRTSKLDPDKNETKWTYDGTHDVLSMTTPKGETTTIVRDAHGNAETVSRPAPGKSTQTTTYHYDTHGNVTSEVDPLKHTWKYEYNIKGNRTAVIDPEGDKRTYAYNEDSYETSMVSPDGNAKGAEASQYTTKIERDTQNRVTTVTDPLGHTNKHTYDGNGNLETFTNGQGRTTTYTYNGDNQATKMKAPNGTTTETGYDGAGGVTGQTDGNKHTTTYVRNILGEVSEIKDPLGRVRKFEYDAAGNLTGTVDAAKRKITYVYDPANHLTEVTYSDGKTPTVKYEYDADGARTKMTDGTGKTTYTYDILERLVQSTDGNGDTTGYEYDLSGEQVKLTYPGGGLVTRAYDGAGRLQSVSDPSKNTTTFAYDPNSNLTTTTFPKASGNQDKVAYNRMDQVMKVTMTGSGLKVLASVAYGRDNDGQVKTSATTGLPGTASTTYGYDANSRLTSAGATAYEYDAADDPTKTGASTNTYDAANELETGTGVSYGYDQLGERVSANPKAGQAITYGYDQAGNLTQVKQAKAGLNDLYTYDGDGLRSAQLKGKTTVNHLSWDVHAGLPLILGDEAGTYIYGPGGMPIEAIQSKGAVLYMHHDQQGSTRLLTGASGAIEATSTYDAYGNLSASTGSARTPLGYDGQYTNTDTGLIYLHVRTYDPATAQFLTTDPLTSLTWARYLYARGNPLNWLDPAGLLAGQICVGGSISTPFGTIEGNVCYVSTPGGEGLAVTDGYAPGPGFGATLHAGAGDSNAETPEEYGGRFATGNVSATYGVGGYASGFVSEEGQCGRFVTGGTVGGSVGFGADAGVGVSETRVFTF